MSESVVFIILRKKATKDKNTETSEHGLEDFFLIFLFAYKMYQFEKNLKL